MPQALCFALSCSVFAFHPPFSDVGYAACPQLHARVRSVVCNESDVSPLLCLVMRYKPRFLIPCCSVVRALCCRALCCVFSAPRRFHSQNPCVAYRTLCAFPRSCASGVACHSNFCASDFYVCSLHFLVLFKILFAVVCSGANARDIF